MPQPASALARIRCPVFTSPATTSHLLASHHAGAGLGGLVGGLLYGSLGASALFRTAALALAAGWLGALAVLRVWGGSSGGYAAQQVQQSAEGQGQLERQASGEEGEAAALLRP